QPNERKRPTNDSPSPLNGERAGVRVGTCQLWRRTEAIGRSTPHPHSLSPLRGEGGPGSRARKSLRGLRRLSNHGTHSRRSRNRTNGSDRRTILPLPSTGEGRGEGERVNYGA